MRFFLAAMFALLTGPTLAQSCPDAVPVSAGAATGDAPVLISNAAMQLALRPAPQVHFSVPTRRSDDATAFGGIAVVTIATPGIWSIGLGGGAWIEVVQDGKAVPSSAHSHGDGCITKTVVFPLKPGRATIELSSSSQQSVRVVAKPAN